MVFAIFVKQKDRSLVHFALPNLPPWSAYIRAIPSKAFPLLLTDAQRLPGNYIYQASLGQACEVGKLDCHFGSAWVSLISLSQVNYVPQLFNGNDNANYISSLLWKLNDTDLEDASNVRETISLSMLLWETLIYCSFWEKVSCHYIKGMLPFIDCSAFALVSLMGTLYSLSRREFLKFEYKHK
jgi:hypothetical protein